MFKNRKSIRINNRKLMYSMLIFVLIGIATMTIAYATLSTTLRITGSAEFENASWELKLDELPIPDLWEMPEENINGNYSFLGDAKLLQKPTMLGTSISNFKVSLKNITDELWQSYVITNIGEVPARLEEIIYYDWYAESSVYDQDEVDLIYENFLFYADLWEGYLENGELIDYGVHFGEDDILCPGASIAIEIYTGYEYDAPRVPYKAITISNLGMDFNFIAADQNLCNGDTPVTPNNANDA